MNTKNKNNDISEKISSHNLNVLQEFNKELENECISKENKNIYHKLLIQTIFNILNSQISLIFQISKMNKSSSNNLNTIENIISFNKDLMLKQIQKIISLINYNKNEIKKNLTTNGNINYRNKKRIKKELNKSFLTTTSFNAKNKAKLKIKNNKKIILDSDLSIYDYSVNCTTQEKESILNDKSTKNKNNHKLNSFKESRNKNIYNKKYVKTTENINLNHNLINYVINRNKFINKNKTQEKNMCLISKTISLSPFNKIKKEDNNSRDNNINEEEENPVRKVKQIIINAKKNASISKDKSRKKENNDTNNRNSCETNIRICRENKEKNNSQKINSSETNSKRYKNLYNEFTESLNEIKFNNYNQNNHDKSSIIHYGNNNKRIKKDRESRQLLQDGMKNMKNRLILSKLHKK